MNDSSELRILGAWLTEWTAWQNLSATSLSFTNPELNSGDEDSLSSESARAALRNAVRPYAAHPAPVGEVRLLSARLTPGVERPVYVAVLREAGEWRLIVPFGPFSVPGTPDELLLEDIDGAAEAPFRGGLSVMETREAVWATNEQLEKSWVAGRLPQKALEDVEAVLQAHFNHVPLDEEVSERVGVRVSPRSSDPRHAHIREEANLLSGVGGLQPVWIEEVEAEQGSRAVAFAADDSEVKGETRIFLVPEKKVEIKLLRGAGSHGVVVSVFGEDGELSDLLNGCKICGLTGSEISVITGSVAKVAVEQLAGAFGLQTVEGQPLHMIRKV